jgi:outer membrane receptor protein involved in Fe transport
MMRRNAITLFASALLLAWAHRASAQTPCEDALRDAEKSYELGLFEDVPGKLSPCLGKPTSRSVAIQVHSLLARAYLNNEEPEQARKEISTLLRLQSNYEAEAGSSARFLALLAQVRREEQTTQVASVSKTNENLREAPATVVVVTADEIQHRGYLDIEDLLHDLPGFDISRVNGDIYSFINLRGYRTSDNDRLLFIVDGVEQNELASNTLYLSRQYALSNVARVEVVYGPASTIYGANAYTGVVSIITKEPEAILGKDKSFTLSGQVTAGGYGNTSVETTLAGRDGAGTVAWSITGNFQTSRARNLSGYPDWDYSYRNVNYRALMNLTGPQADDFMAKGLCVKPSSYFRCDAANHSVELTLEGETLVRGLDAALIRDNHLGFDDRAQNTSLYGKVRISNLTLGLEIWQSQEGVGSTVLAKRDAGNTFWSPRETAFYVKYTLPLNRVKLNFFSRYLQTSHQRSDTEFAYLHNYAVGNLSMWSLVSPCVAPGDPEPISCAPGTPWVERAVFGSLSSQLRNELTLVYQPSDKMSGVSGVEFTKSSIQTTLDVHEIAPIDLGNETSPAQIEHTDVAVYAQATLKPRPSFRYVLAGRLSYNTIDNKPGAYGFGTLFTPRAAVIYSPLGSAVVLKAIYSEAFKDPPDIQKFGTLRRYNEVPSAGLRPEKVKNVELSAGWQPTGTLSAEASLFRAHYTNVVSYGTLPGCTSADGCLQYQNRDDDQIRGLQVTARYRRADTEIWGSYTHTEAYQVHPQADTGGPLLDGQGHVVERIWQADIAANRMNVNVGTDWWYRFRSDLRLRYVGPRRTGEGTTQADSPFRRMDSYASADLALSWSHLFAGTRLQLIVNNVFNKQYFDPTPYPVNGPARIPQAGRTVYLRLVYSVPANSSGRQ